MALRGMAVAALLSSAAAGTYNGDATWYGGAGKGGACTSDYVPAGFKTVAMNAPQFADGKLCGACVSGTINGGEQFQAIVDNLCPECAHGSLDMGWSGNGRVPVTWDFIPCPASDPIYRQQGSNGFYAKLKVEGVGPIASVTINGMPADGTPDGYWVVNDGSGGLGCANINVTTEGGQNFNSCQGGLFAACNDGGCNGGGGGGGGAEQQVQQPANSTGSGASPSSSGKGASSDSSSSSSSSGKVQQTTGTTPTDSTSTGGGGSGSGGQQTTGGQTDGQRAAKRARHAEQKAACRAAGGVPHVPSGACCPKSCGDTCGGPDCSTFRGGSADCCSSDIQRTGRTCDTDAPPCMA